LLGQNVNAYNGLDEHNNVSNLGSLITKLSKIDGLKRIRYMTSHPRSMHDDLFRAHEFCEKLMPFVHLPVQSGSDKILKAMNRKHTVAEYLASITRLKKIRPDMAFSSDFIVGYPGELEEDFQATLNIIEEVSYAQCYSFKYSPRPGTPAAIMENQVPEEVKSQRLARIQALIAKKQDEFNTKAIGKVMPVLFEKKGKHQGQLVGKTPYMQNVYLNNTQEKDLGTIKNVLISNINVNSLEATIKEVENVR
jgi:tRNA-2-methylthio-N6-dimethylallyladenosine synthase